MRVSRPAKPPRGFSLIEVLVTFMLLAIGLASLAGLQARATLGSLEAYQRTQALLLAMDMAARIAANKPDAPRYIGDGYGTGDVTACPPQPGVDGDRCTWSNALRGASEQSGTRFVGGLTGGFGCVRNAGASIAVMVAWQGMLPTAAPAVDCGGGRYGDDALRRVIVMPVPLATLAGS